MDTPSAAKSPGRFTQHTLLSSSEVWSLFVFQLSPHAILHHIVRVAFHNIFRSLNVQTTYPAAYIHRMQRNHLTYMEVHNFGSSDMRQL